MSTVDKPRYPESVNIYTEANPNPNSMKFMLNFMLTEDGKTYDFADVESAKDSLLATELFEQFPYITRVFMMSNFVTLTKDESKDWLEVTSELKAYIKKFFEDAKPLLNEDASELGAVNDSDTEAVKMIKGVLEEYIKPAVEMDGGAIQFHSFDEEKGKVKVLLQGACSGCPSSTITLKHGIENLLKRMVPTVKEVEAEGV